ncbi:type VI secretion system lipoprotein TssJ [Pseudomonas soli]|jgi:type VI secretion system protein VasD|uniref:Type VI secretion system lipoprotein TssJ n=1 Tax=Pseudomonas soli TaxID=1306993 RepID=A0A2V4HFD7_9PSED|nr:type VI secretion system lipoprotein TssJ [Pseudomonas soli]PYB76161.1 type VI secretion system lipoprotein TssJ [Pseudomonas soli]
MTTLFLRAAALRAAVLLLALCLAAGCTALGKIGQVVMDPSIPVGALSDQPTEVAFSLHASPTVNGNPHSLDTTTPGALPEPTPYAVSLRAGDPHALTEKVASLLEHLQEQFPAMSPVALEDELTAAYSPMTQYGPGSYEAEGVQLELPPPAPEAARAIATPIAIKILQLRDDSLLRNSLYPQLDRDPAKALRSTYIRDDDYLLTPGQFKFVRFEPIAADTRFIAVIAHFSDIDNATWRQVIAISPRGRQVVLAVTVDEAQIRLQEES